MQHLSVASSRLEKASDSNIKAFTFKSKISQLSGLIQGQRKS